jgi:hypothetical protein
MWQANGVRQDSPPLWPASRVALFLVRALPGSLDNFDRRWNLIEKPVTDTPPRERSSDSVVAMTSVRDLRSTPAQPTRHARAAGKGRPYDDIADVLANSAWSMDCETS